METTKRANKMKRRRTSKQIVLTGVLGLATAVVSGAEPAGTAVPEPGDFTLEQLINIKVTSVSKKEEKLNDAASAISILSNDDLRRSGATSVAEALRLIPGMDVSRINSGTWAISARG